MVGFPKLTSLTESLDEFADHAREWTRLAGRASLLEEGIREAVGEALAPDGLNPVPRLSHCWNRLSPAHMAKQIKVSFADEYEPGPQVWNLDLVRLHRNASAMLATGLAAATAAQAVSGHTAEEDLFGWWREAAALLGGKASSQVPRFDSSKLHSHNEGDAVSRTQAILESAYREATELGWDLAGPYRWTVDWLGKPGWGWPHRVTAKVAGVHASQPRPGFPKQLRGFLADLDLELLSDEGSVLVEHPSVRLRPFDGEFLNGIEAAWRGAVESTGKRSSACWSLAVPTDVAPPWQPLYGDSLSGAAVRAFWHLVQRKAPDAGIVVLACVDRESLATNGEVLLKEVDSETIHLKVIAAAADPSTDTIIVAGDGNAAKARETLADLVRRKELCGGHIRVVNIAAGES